MQKGALPGFRDFYPDALAERAYLMRTWREVARRYAFVEYDGPPLEPLELYTRKSGDEIVGQLYNFTDKGGREVALRPEMTPTLARMVGAKAAALRKPVRWFSMPQLFRYERQQRGRLREHFQLNVDIVGEADVTADAELLAVAVDIMRELGLTAEDVRARVSDRRLLRAILVSLGVAESALTDVFGVLDKIERQPQDVSRERLAALGLDAAAVQAVLGFASPATLESLRERFGRDAEVAERLSEMERYLGYLDRLGVGEFVTLDLTIVRGLAYYTGIVFELFDAKGELRAICGGGRYDTLLESLGGTSLPALGFGMGDVVLAELLRARGLNVAPIGQPDFWLAAQSDAVQPFVMTAATLLRRERASVEYALRPQALGKQRKAAVSAGASYLVVLADDFADSGAVEITSLMPAGEGADVAPLLDYLRGRPHTLPELLEQLRAHRAELLALD